MFFHFIKICTTYILSLRAINIKHYISWGYILVSILWYTIFFCLLAYLIAPFFIKIFLYWLSLLHEITLITLFGNFIPHIYLI